MGCDKDICLKCPLKDEEYVPPELKKNSKILFVGKNPGTEDVKYGYPFCHKSVEGSYFRKMIAPLSEKGIIYSIVNGAGCYTLENKSPGKRAIDKCASLLQYAIEYTKPELIVTLGKDALYAVTGRKKGVKDLCGKILRGYNTPILVCVHPRYVLHSKVRGEAEKMFEKGILPAIHFFDKQAKLKVKEFDRLEPREEELGFDIECDSLDPHKGIIKCFSVSDGIKAIFVDVRNKEVRNEKKA